MFSFLLKYGSHGGSLRAVGAQDCSWGFLKMFDPPAGHLKEDVSLSARVASSFQLRNVIRC